MKWSFWIDRLEITGRRKFIEGSTEIKVENMERDSYVTSGVTMMKYFLDTYNRMTNPDSTKNSKLKSTSAKKYYLDVKMDGNDMVIYNSKVHRSTEDGRPTIRFNKNWP